MAGKYCVYHQGVAAVARCRKCHKLVCKNCMVMRNDDTFCSDACLEEYDHFQSKYKAPKASKRTIIGQLTMLVGAIVIVIIAIKLGAARNVPFFVRLNQKLFGAGEPPPQGQLEAPESPPSRR